MLNEQKVKAMTKLAIYEKNIGKEDLKINDYFKHDYILVNNIKTRIAITIACVILFGGHALMEFFIFLDQTSNLDFVSLGIVYSVLYVMLLTFYSLISTRIYAKRYNEAQARLGGYRKLLSRVNEYNQVEKND